MTDRGTHTRVWLLTLNRFETRLRLAAARARNAFLREAGDAYEQNQTVPGWVPERHRRAVQTVLATHYAAVAPHFAGLLDKQFASRKSRSFERKELSGLFLALMQEWINTQSLGKARYIVGTDMDDVRAAIADGVDEGDGTEEIARRIRRVRVITPARAATIGRTETNAAATFGYVGAAREAERDLGIRLVKVWLPTFDDRTRPDHQAMADHPAIPLDEKFTVGTSLMDRPGDPSAPPEQVINCRCALAVEEATD